MGGSTHHHPFQSLSPLSWTTDLSSGTSPEVISKVITDTFSNAQILVDSLPPSPSHSQPTTRPRSQTESATAALDLNSVLSSSPETKATVEKLRKEWKEVKTNPRDNPHGITVYKLSAKDGKGAWFGRYSLHHGMDFGRWEEALRREFKETLKRCEREGKEPGCGNIRGIGAERVVERVEGEEGLMEVFQVSARFGGPTTARDFIALHMTPPVRKETDGDKQKKGRGPRQFMLVSRPVEHPDCPPRSGFIRGVYESVEVIREVPVVKPLRRTRSSGDWGEHDGKDDKDVALRSAKKAIEERQDSEEEDVEMAIEWLMVTRSDPGGSVPRFMVEKGTPGGIVNDAGQFLKWFEAQQQRSDDDETAVDGDHEGEGEEVSKAEGKKPEKIENGGAVDSSVLIQLRDTDHNGEVHRHDKRGEVTPPSGFYGMIASALGAAGSAVASKVATLAGSTIATEDEESLFNDDDDESDTSSELSFASASEGHNAEGGGGDNDVTAAGLLSKADSHNDVASTLSSVSPSSLHSNDDNNSVAHTSHSASLSSQHEKELKKLQERMKKAQAKLERSHQRRHHNHHKESDEVKEEAALQRLKEKHERGIAKQKEKYEREVRRLAEKKQQEEKKKEEKRRKMQEREERADLAMELERTRAERDVARKEIEILRGQVGDLQRENTMLVARLGKMGVGVGDIYDGGK
ncbi:hypothetical protein QC761_706960 [Podospora bellae-mahoneyi]|uniref:DUF3074 domain-containing protein n=1 Tax=Podospora bellae-mahoneyi TaxID=2093777 RepID=A0ABR0F8E5_9PEZI|nr:hypothetical protein QC761_706960 [Podospora bellae-mahoneyi]